MIVRFHTREEAIENNEVAIREIAMGTAVVTSYIDCGVC